MWIGLKASKEERRQGLQMANEYLKAQGRPSWIPISKILEGGENELFKSYMAGGKRSFGTVPVIKKK